MKKNSTTPQSAARNAEATGLPVAAALRTEDRAALPAKAAALQGEMKNASVLMTTQPVKNSPKLQTLAKPDAAQMQLDQEFAKQSGASSPTVQSSANRSVQTTQSTPNVEKASYVDPNGQQQVGYIIDGTTYTDPSGTTPVPVGSTVTTAGGQQWYKGEHGSVPVERENAEQTSYVDPDGTKRTGYIINGVTYTDAAGTTPIPVGSTVTTADGRHWYKGEHGSYYITENEYQRNLSDLSPLIHKQYDAADEALRLAVNQATQQSVDQLNRAMQDAQPSYEDAIANQLLETRQAQDAQALRNQVNGDRGGIGSAQIDSLGTAGAKNREAIATQQRQLATDTARQIADLRAQGKYQEASNLLQSAQQRLAALYNEGVRLQQEYSTKQTQMAKIAAAYLEAGVVPPTDEMLAAIGMDRATAQQYVDTFGASYRSAGGTGASGKSGTSGGKTVDWETRQEIAAAYEAGGADAVAARLSWLQSASYDTDELALWLGAYYDAPQDEIVPGYQSGNGSGGTGGGAGGTWRQEAQ